MSTGQFQPLTEIGTDVLYSLGLEWLFSFVYLPGKMCIGELVKIRKKRTLAKIASTVNLEHYVSKNLASLELDGWKGTDTGALQTTWDIDSIRQKVR